MDVAIRVATAADGAAVQAIYAPYVAATPISFEMDPPDEAAMRGRIERIGGRYPWLLAEDDGQVVGYAYASPHAERAAYLWSVDVAVYVAQAATGRGIGRSLYDRLMPILRRLGYHAAYAGIALPNAASVGLHEACGFVSCGVFREVGFKMGAWRDVGWWQLTLTEGGSEPAPPSVFTPEML